MNEIYLKQINDRWQSFTLNTSTRVQKNQGQIVWYVGEVVHQNHNPNHERMILEGWHKLIVTIYDSETHKLVPESYTVDGETLSQDVVALTTKELEANEDSIKETKIMVVSNAVQEHLDNKALEHGYDNIVNACGYASAPNPFQNESLTFVSWRGNIWDYAYQVLADVEAGNRVEPTIEELLSELPELVL